ncbi:hypothetical protein L596_016088 [Steinernema carpocapsae]|uniref:Uncharacterized protein n=1 Tax=Steinernema carpocapsae TaxID=34508 RepID=A0A4U5NGY9_STECR|nr:hypothetical protein L596_016088 [Steinernema carpocapsae]
MNLISFFAIFICFLVLNFDIQPQLSKVFLDQAREISFVGARIANETVFGDFGNRHGIAEKAMLENEARKQLTEFLENGL